MSYNVSPMTLADFMDFVAPVLPPAQRTTGCKAMLQGPAWTIRQDDAIIGCYGFAPVMPGCGEAWMIATPTLRANPRGALKYAKRVIASLCQAKTFRRLQALVQEDNMQHRNWVEHLGFRVEGVMVKYGPNGENFLRYVILP